MPLQSDKLKLLRRIPDIRFEEELRGYSKSQVDRVLENLAPLADEIELIQQRLAEAESRAASAEARLMERMQAPAPAPVAPVAPEPSPIPATPADFDETLRRTLLMAQRTADETVREATDEAERLRNNAHNEADQMVAKARAESAALSEEAEQRRSVMMDEALAEKQRLLSEARTEAEARRTMLETELNDAEGSLRAELLEQIANLQHIRGLLTNDIETLEAHLGRRRTSVRTALSEMLVVIDDPSAFNAEPVPEVTEIEPVEQADYQPIGIELPSLAMHEAGIMDDGAAREARVDEAPLPSRSSSARLEAAAEGPSHAQGSGPSDEGPTVHDAELHDAEFGRAAVDRAGYDRDDYEGSTDLGAVEPGDISVEGFVDDVTSSAAFGDIGSDDVVAAFAVGDAEPTDAVDRREPAEVALQLDDPFALGDAASPFASVPGVEEAGLPDLPGLSVEEFRADAADRYLVSPEVIAADVASADDAATQEFSFSEFTQDSGTEDDTWGRDASREHDLGWAEGPAPVSEHELSPPPPIVGQDPFLEQLRQATSDEDPSDEALDRFFEGSDDMDRKGGWFGRRK